mmetsp:Transcript_23606/g.35849  ORF Transcript_23606/g.35849 Transcript_23606/m.35849 type:complete len:196 (+) Transcript_23606:495-1082(+)
MTKPPYENQLPPFQSNHKLSDKLLQGDTSNFENTDPIIRDLLQQLQQIPNLTEISHKISTTDFIQGMKKVSEGKSSSGSGRNYSLYKSILHFPYTTNLIVKLLSTCTEKQIILSRWKQVIQVMLCKYPGNYKLDKLRVIQLLEADLNMYLRIVWGKRLVSNALTHHLFAPEQFGNKPGTFGSSAGTLKTLSFDQV